MRLTTGIALTVLNTNLKRRNQVSPKIGELAVGVGFKGCIYEGVSIHEANHIVNALSSNGDNYKRIPLRATEFNIKVLSIEIVDAVVFVDCQARHGYKVMIEGEIE
jgi:hypothetical protein